MNIQRHCPLCTQPLEENAALLFLDLDGVLIDRTNYKVHQRIYATLETMFGELKSDEQKYSELQWRIAASHHFLDEPLESLKTLINRVQKVRPLHIILSSAWRNDGSTDEVKQVMFAQHAFSKLLVGKTPAQNDEKWTPEIENGQDFEIIAKEKYALSLASRAGQIDFWLREHAMENTDFVILDDCDDKLSDRFSNRFVFVPFYLSPKEVDKALEILKI